MARSHFGAGTRPGSRGALPVFPSRMIAFPCSLTHPIATAPPWAQWYGQRRSLAFRGVVLGASHESWHHLGPRSLNAGMVWRRFAARVRMPQSSPQSHRSDRIGSATRCRPRANDGIVSTGSLVLGVAAAGRPTMPSWSRVWPAWSREQCRWRPVEYVSVRSQADSEAAALTLERAELEADDPGRGAN